METYKVKLKKIERDFHMTVTCNSYRFEDNKGHEDRLYLNSEGNLLVVNVSKWDIIHIEKQPV